MSRKNIQVEVERGMTEERNGSGEFNSMNPKLWSQCVGNKIIIGVGDQYFREKEAYLRKANGNHT